MKTNYQPKKIQDQANTSRLYFRQNTLTQPATYQALLAKFLIAQIESLKMNYQGLVNMTLKP